MKITVLEEPGAQKELIIRCEAVDAEIQGILQLLGYQKKRFIVKEGTKTRFLDLGGILYCEYVDYGVFAYTQKEVLPTESTLAEIEKDFAPYGFIRCSKSMVVNIGMIDALKSEAGGRIIATISNGERIVISRHYAKGLREMLLK